MRVKVIQEFESARGTIPVGRIIEISAVLLERLKGKVEPVTADQNEATELWRWFVLEADKVYRQSPKTADSWNLHKRHRKAADDLCGGGNISAARAELEKALTALHGVTITQHELFFDRSEEVQN